MDPKITLLTLFEAIEAYKKKEINRTTYLRILKSIDSDFDKSLKQDAKKLIEQKILESIIQ